MSLNEVWEEVSATPFHPLIDKDSQFAIGFNLLLAGMNSTLKLRDNLLTYFIKVLLFTGIFGLSMSI